MEGAEFTEQGPQYGGRDPLSYRTGKVEDRVIEPPKGGWTPEHYSQLYGDLGWKLYHGIPPEAAVGHPQRPMTPPRLGVEGGKVVEQRTTPPEAGMGGLPRVRLNEMWNLLPPSLKDTVDPERPSRFIDEILGDMSPVEVDQLIRTTYALQGLSLDQMPAMDMPYGPDRSVPKQLGPHVYMPVFAVYDQVPMRTALGLQTGTVRRKLTPEQIKELEPDMTDQEIYRLEMRGGVYEVEVAVRPGTAGMGSVGRRELVIGDKITELMREVAEQDMEGEPARRVEMSREDIAREFLYGGEAAIRGLYDARLQTAQEDMGRPQKPPPEGPAAPPAAPAPRVDPALQRFGPEGVAGLGEAARELTGGGTRGKVLRRLSDEDVEQFAAEVGQDAVALKAEGVYEVEVLDGPNAGGRIELVRSDLLDRPAEQKPPPGEQPPGKPEPKPPEPEPEPAEPPPPAGAPPDIPTGTFLRMGRPGSARAGQVQVDTQMALIHPDDIRHSKHPDYLDERLQKRRDDAESAETVDFLTKNQVLQELTDSKQASDGAPLLLRDNSILSGNHRFWAWLRIMTEPEFANRRAEYIEWAKDEALKLGIEVDAELWEAPLPPMLVRRITSPFESWDQMIKFAMDANEGTPRPEGPLGQATTDAARLKLEDLALFDPKTELTSAANRQFAMKFRERLGTSKGITSGGELNQNGIRRLKNAVMVMAYGLTKKDHPKGPEMSDAVLLTMMETSLEGTKRLNNMLLQASGEWAKFRKSVRDGDIDARADLTADLVSAVAKIVAIKEAASKGEDVSIDKFFRQIELSEEFAYPESMKYLVALLGETRKADVMAAAGIPDIRIQPGKNRIFIANSADMGAQLLRNYIEQVHRFADRSTENMFGERDVPPTLDMLKSARRALEETEREKHPEGGLLEDPVPSPDVPPDAGTKATSETQKFYDAVAKEGQRKPRLAKLMDAYAQRLAGELSSKDYAAREKGLSATWALNEQAVREAKTIVDGVVQSGIKPGKVEGAEKAPKPEKPEKPEGETYTGDISVGPAPGGGQQFYILYKGRVASIDPKFAADLEPGKPGTVPISAIDAQTRAAADKADKPEAPKPEGPKLPSGADLFEKDVMGYVGRMKDAKKIAFARLTLDFYLGKLTPEDYASISGQMKVPNATVKTVTETFRRKWGTQTGEILVKGALPKHLTPQAKPKPAKPTKAERPPTPKAAPDQAQRSVDLQWERGYEHIEKSKNAKEREFLELVLHERLGVIDTRTFHDKADKLDLKNEREVKLGDRLVDILDRAEQDARIPEGMTRKRMLALEDKIEKLEQKYFWEEGLSDKAKAKTMDGIVKAYRELQRDIPQELLDAIEASVSTGANAGDKILMPVEKDGKLEFKEHTILDTSSDGTAVKIERGGEERWVKMDDVFPKREFEEFLRESNELIESFDKPEMREAAKAYRDSLLGKDKPAETPRYGEEVEVRSTFAEGEHGEIRNVERWVRGKIVGEEKSPSGEPLYRVQIEGIDTPQVVPFRDIRALKRGESRMASSKESDMRKRMLELWRKRKMGQTPGVRKAQGKVPKGDEGGTPEPVGVPGRPGGTEGGVRGNSAPPSPSPVGPTPRGDRPHPDAGELDPDTGGSGVVGGGVSGPSTISPGLGASVVSTGAVKQKRSIFSAIRESRLLRPVVAAAEWNLFSPARKAAWKAAGGSRVVAPYQGGARFWRSPGERQLVESRGQAGVPFTENTYQPTRELMELHKKGNLFNHQMDGVAMAMQASESGGHGVLIADAPGVGKTRVIGGIAHELVSKGARRILVTTIGAQNVENVKAEFTRMFDGKPPFDMKYLVKDFYFKENTKKGGRTIIPKIPSDTVRPTVYFMDQSNFAKFLPMMVDAKFDAWLADEAHTFRRTETQKAGQWRELHIDFERRGNHRIHYLTATPAAEIRDFSHYYNLGMYSTLPGSFEQWLSVVSGRGRQMTQAQWISSQIETLRTLLEDKASPAWKKKHAEWERDLTELEARAELLPPPEEQVTQHVKADDPMPSFLPAEYEQIARELKASGKFRALDVWRGDLELDVIEKKMLPEQVTKLDQVAELLRATELLFQTARKSGAPEASKWGVRSGLQFEIKRRMYHMKKDLIMKSAKDIIARGGNVVFSVINVSPTGETGGHLGGAIRQIPTSRTVKRGLRKVIITEETHPNDPHVLRMKAAKEELLRRAREEVGELSNPIEDIIREFGAENVGLIIGERTIAERESDRKEFQENKRRVMVISPAGAAGIDLHNISKKGLENTELKGQVTLIALDTEMSPMEMIQKLGRVDRVGQISTPRLFLTSLGTAADKKFISSITAKLQGLGAMSRGLSRATGTENLEAFDFFDPISQAALRLAWSKAGPGGFTAQEKSFFVKRDFIDPKSWKSGIPGQMTPVKNLLKATPKDFLADLQLIPKAIGDAMFKKWLEVRRGLMLGGAVDEGKVEKENYADLAKEARELGMTPEQLRWFRQDAALRRSRFDTGKLLKDVELTPHLALTIVRSDKGGVYGLLNGVFTDRMQAILEDGIGRSPTGKLPARSYVNFRSDEGAEISGLRIRRSSVDRVADLYAKRVLDQQITAENAVDFLRMDKTLELRDRPWRLRLRPDDTVIVSVNRSGGTISKWAEELKANGALVIPGKNVFALDIDQVPRWIEKFGVQLAPEGNASDTAHSRVRPSQDLSHSTRNFAIGSNPPQPMPTDVKARRKLLKKVARGEDVRAAWRMINDFAVKLDQVVRRGTLGKRGTPQGTGTLGFYRINHEVIRRRYLHEMKQTIKTVGHEFGHHLAKKLFGWTLAEAGLRGDEVGRSLDFRMFEEPYKSELDTLSQEHGKPELSEGWANFFMYYILDREYLRQEAPHTYDYVDRRLRQELPEWKELYDTANADYMRHKEAPALAQVGSMVSYGNPKHRNVQPFDRWYSQMVDGLHIPDLIEREQFLQGRPISAGERGVVQMRLNRGSQARFEFFTTRGQFSFHGLRRLKSQVPDTPFTGKDAPGMKQILAYAGWKDRIEWANYAIALRTLELRNTRGIQGVPLPNEVIKRAIAEGKSERFDRAIELYQEYNKNLMQYARDAGLLDADGFGRILAMNQYYIPFRRLVEDTPLEQRAAAKTGTGKKLVNLPTPFKKIKKDVDLPILDPIEAIFENSELVIRTADRAYATKMFIDNARTYEGLGAKIEKMMPDPNNPGELIPVEITTKGMGKYVEPVPRSKYPIHIRVEEILKKKQLAELRKRMKDMGLDKVLEDAERELVTIFRNTPTEDSLKNTVLVWENGKRSAYRLSPELFEALSGLDAQAVNFNLGFMRAPARWLQKGALSTVGFAQRNPARDQVAAYVYSNYGYKPAYSWMRGMFHVLSSKLPPEYATSLWEDWNLSGAPVSLSGVYRSFRVNPLRRGGSYAKEAMKSPAAKFARLVYNPLELLATVSEAMEHATRIGEFERGVWKEGKGGRVPFVAPLVGSETAGRARARGRKEMAGPALASREVTVDFSRRGLRAEMQALSQLVPFFNANVQGISRMFQAFGGEKINPYGPLERALRAKTTRRRTTIKLIKGVTVPSVLLALANRKNDAYNALSDVDKDLYWHFFIGKYHIRYPKPHELGMIFGAIPERAIRWLHQKDPHALDGSAHALFQQLPNVIPTIMLPFLEWVSNYSRFWGRSIEPAHMVEQLPDFLRYDPRTTETARWLADVSESVPGLQFGVGPKKLENTVRTLFGGAGMTGVRFLDYVLFDVAGSKTLPDRTWAELVVPGFAGRLPGAGAAPFERVYSEMRAARQILGGYEKLLAEGRVEKAKAFAEKHEALFGMYAAFVPIAQALSARRREADAIYSDNTIPGPIKRQMLDERWLEMVKIAQEFHRVVHPGSEPHPILGEESEDTLQGVRRLLGLDVMPQKSRIQELLEMPGVYPYDQEAPPR
jgi:hypothetical protein